MVIFSLIMLSSKAYSNTFMSHSTTSMTSILKYKMSSMHWCRKDRWLLFAVSLSLSFALASCIIPLAVLLTCFGTFALQIYTQRFGIAAACDTDYGCLLRMPQRKRQGISLDRRHVQWFHYHMTVDDKPDNVENSLDRILTQAQVQLQVSVQYVPYKHWVCVCDARLVTLQRV